MAIEFDAWKKLLKKMEIRSSRGGLERVSNLSRHSLEGPEFKSSLRHVYMVPRSCYYWLITLWVSLSLKGRITILKYIQNSLLNFWQLSLMLGKFAEKDGIYFYSKFGDFQLFGKNAFHVFQVEGHHSLTSSRRRVRHEN